MRSTRSDKHDGHYTDHRNYTNLLIPLRTKMYGGVGPVPRAPTTPFPLVDIVGRSMSWTLVDVGRSV